MRCCIWRCRPRHYSFAGSDAGTLLPYNLPAFDAAGTHQHRSISDSIHPGLRAKPRLHDLRKSPARWLRGRLPRTIICGADAVKFLRAITMQIDRQVMQGADTNAPKISRVCFRVISHWNRHNTR